MPNGDPAYLQGGTADPVVPQLAICQVVGTRVCHHDRGHLHWCRFLQPVGSAQCPLSSLKVCTLKKARTWFSGIFRFKREMILAPRSGAIFFTWKGLLAVRFRQFVMCYQAFRGSDFGSAQDTIGSAQLMIGSARALPKVYKSTPMIVAIRKLFTYKIVLPMNTGFFPRLTEPSLSKWSNAFFLRVGKLCISWHFPGNVSLTQYSRARLTSC